jgi:phosphohistidine phosphatase
LHAATLAAMMAHMEVFLVRHAIAVERSPALEDQHRPLSERGRLKFGNVVRGLGRLGIEFDHVFHSPWLRALETAELLAPLTRGEREATKLLADDPGVELLELIDLANQQTGAERVACVGHEPWMAELCALLLAGDTGLADHVPFKKGGVAWLVGQARPAGMRLCAMLPPKILRRVNEKEAS